jgi:hypothetical protein
VIDLAEPLNLRLDNSYAQLAPIDWSGVQA